MHSVPCLNYQVKSLNFSTYVIIFASLQGIHLQKQTWGLTGIQTPLHTETEVCDLRFWVLFNPLRLCRFCSGTWLWSPVPVASDQTKNRNSFPRRSFMMPGFSHLSVSPRCCSRNPESKVGFFFFSFFSASIAVVSLRVSLRYSQASLWWDQAMFGHECGFGRRDVNEGEWNLTE